MMVFPSLLLRLYVIKAQPNSDAHQILYGRKVLMRKRF